MGEGVLARRREESGRAQDKDCGKNARRKLLRSVHSPSPTTGRSCGGGLSALSLRLKVTPRYK
eukprot:scaffold55295_cov27-Tisochrysis_lutea.AAC.4